jgi:desulfoferrodoxin (superoxide reductase-like protein)
LTEISVEAGRLEMKKKMSALLLLAILVFTSEALANKTSVTIAAPESVAAGTEVTITIKVSHKGNSAFHFTNWVVIKADGKEIARWDFKSSNRPESEEFSRQAAIKVDKPVEITAEGHCIIHGSNGPATLRIALK